MKENRTVVAYRGAYRLSPALFGMALLCFFLPFINVSCGGTKVIQLTGVQLALARISKNLA